MTTERSSRLLQLFVTCVLTTSAVMAVAPVAAQSDAAGPAGEAQPVPATKGPIEPGRYRDSSAGTTVELSFDEGWQVLYEPLPQGGVTFGLADSEGAELNLIPYVGRLYTDPCWTADNRETYAEIIAYGEPTSAGLVDYLTTQPSIIATATDTTLGGLPASQVDLEIAVSDGCYDKLGLWHSPPFNWTAENGWLGRAVAVDTERGTFVALILGSPDLYPTLLEKATSALDSLEFPLEDR